jgi:hypothetical protein
LEREWRRRRGQKNRRKYRAGGKDLKQTNTDQPSRFQRRCSFFASVPRSVSLHLSQHAFFCFVFALFKWILIHLNSNMVSLHAFYFIHKKGLRPFCVQPGHFLGQEKERERDLWFSGIFILRSEFFIL